MHWKPVYSWFYVCVLWLSWQIELHCYWCVLSLQDSLLYFWLGLVRLLSNWKKYMWGRKLQEEFGCVFNCHLSGALVPFAMVPEKRVLGALVEQLCFIEWLFQQHDARNFGNDLLSGFFLSLESLSRVLELVNALQVVYPMWWSFTPNVILLPIRCAWNWASMNLSLLYPNGNKLGMDVIGKLMVWEISTWQNKQTAFLSTKNSVDCVMLGDYQCWASIKNAFESHIGILVWTFQGITHFEWWYPEWKLDHHQLKGKKLKRFETWVSSW